MQTHHNEAMLRRAKLYMQLVREIESEWRNRIMITEIYGKRLTVETTLPELYANRIADI